MASSQTRTKLRPVPRTLTGSPFEVRQELVRLHSAGRLVSMTPPVPVPGGQVRADVTVLAPARTAVRRLTRPGRGRLVLIVTTLTVLGLTVYAVTVAVLWVMAHLVLILGILGAAVALALWAASGGRCPGLHCGGCRGGGH